VRAISLKSYEEDIRRLDVALRELKVKYDQFFAGALDRQPFELRAEVERIINRLNKQPPGKLALRFHFNALVSRFNSFSELWGKTLRTMEEGDRRSAAFTDRFDLRERLITRCLLADPDRSREELRRMHARFVAARERHGKRGVPFEKFVRGIATQTARLRARHECDQIEVRLVESDDGVQIKARPGR
jgi:hypothetical protein